MYLTKIFCVSFYRKLDRKGFLEVLQSGVPLPESAYVTRSTSTLPTTPPTTVYSTLEPLPPPGLYRQDLDGMLYYSLYQEVGKMETITNHALAALKDFVRILAKVCMSSLII